MTDPLIDDRVLIHGPRMEDLSSLLYFDRVVYPTLTPFMKPRDLAPGYAGYPQQEIVPEAVRERLGEAKLLLTPGDVVWTNVVGNALQVPGELAASMAEIAGENGRLIGTLLPMPLTLPASDADVTTWLTEIGRTVHEFALALHARGLHTVARLDGDVASTVLGAGWSQAIAVRMQALPRLAPPADAIGEFIAFVTDNRTRSLRAACFNWTALMAEEPRFRLDRMETALAAYHGWLRQNGIRIDGPAGDLEFLLDANAEGPAQGTANSQRVSIGSRGLSAVGSTGSELAVISHRARDWRQWYPGLIS